MVISKGETAIPKEATLEVGEVVSFDPQGHEPVRFTTLLKDEQIDRMCLVRYSQIMLRLSEENVREFDLYDFREDKERIESKQAVSAA
jgi:hypothetical protein